MPAALKPRISGSNRTVGQRMQVRHGTREQSAVSLKAAYRAHVRSASQERLRAPEPGVEVVDSLDRKHHQWAFPQGVQNNHAPRAMNAAITTIAITSASSAALIRRYAS